jgi:hypothetical protein
MSTYPIQISLPDGSTARVRIETRLVTKKKKPAVEQVVNTPPQYELCDGTPIALMVTIPDDLAPHWFWFGSTLCEDSGLVLISTSSYPPPGLNDGRATCFDCARRYEAQQAIQDARRAERLALPQKKARKAPTLPGGVAQMELF